MELYVSDYFGNLLPYIHNKSFRHVTVVFFYTYRLVLRGQSVLQFFKLLFSLANHCSRACSAFDRILAKNPCQKCKPGKMEVIRMQIIFILCQHEAAVSQYTNYTYENSKMLQIFFACA